MTTLTTYLPRYRRIAASAVVAGALALGVVVPAFAADTVTQSITAGTRSASVADVTLPAVNYSHSAQTSTGTMTLSADDSSGSDAGWNVTIVSSAFTNGGATIPASDFSLTSAATPAMTAGQAVDATNGPMVPATSPVGALDAARKVEQANAGYGKGTYTQDLGVSLTIPADSLAGTYTATLTTTIAAAP